MAASKRSDLDADRLDLVLRFISHLEVHKTPYELKSVRPDALMVVVRTPLHSWEIEFMTSQWEDPIQVERLAPTPEGVVGSELLPELFEELEIPDWQPA
jgi:hypothetical protein